MSKSLHFHFSNFQLAWEGMNEFLANNQREITEGGYGGTYGTEIVLYNSLISVDLAKVDKNFDFGRVLGYGPKKWSKLVNNYVDLNYLDLVKSEVLERERKQAKSYNYTVHFDNSHGSGKDCLISLTFQRRVDEDIPKIIFTTRASEATKRMIFDFLLLQRMTEYVYGKKVRVSAELYFPMMYINVESFLVYVGYKGLEVIEPEKNGEYTLYQNRIFKRYEEFTTKPLNEIKYRVHKRAAAQIQKDKHGNPVSGVKTLLAKDLKLIHKPIAIKAKLLDRLNEGITI